MPSTRSCIGCASDRHARGRTGKKVALSDEAVLRTFVNFRPEELVLLRVREHLAKSAEAQKRLREILSGQDPPEQPKGEA